MDIQVHRRGQPNKILHIFDNDPHLPGVRICGLCYPHVLDRTRERHQPPQGTVPPYLD